MRNLALSCSLYVFRELQVNDHLLVDFAGQVDIKNV